MDQEHFEQVSQAIQLATMSPQEQERQQILKKQQKLLEQLRITTEKELPEMEFLFRLFDKPCFPRGELVAVTGKAKSGKTFFTSILMSACVSGKVTELCRKPELPPLRCLWYDTEQSEQSTQEILRERIGQMIHAHTDLNHLTDTSSGLPEELYDVFNVRSQPWQARMGLLECAVDTYHPDIVVVDGVRDLVSDINDGVKAQDIVERLMGIAQDHNCCIVCVLHQNKGAEDRNLRGWIGTEMMNKAFEVYACEKLMPQRIFSVEQTHTRKYDIGQLLFFTVDEQGLPQTTDAPETVVPKYQPPKKNYPPMNEKYIFWKDDTMQVDIRQVFYDVMKNYEALYYNDLQKLVMKQLNCKDSGYWNNLFVRAKNQGIIINTRNAQGKSVWALPKAQVATETPLLFRPPL